MTPSQHGPLIPWATHVLQCMRQQDAISQDGANPYKRCASSDRSLQLDSLKSDSLVIGDQNAPVNTFSDLVLTARHVKRAGNTRSPRVKSGITVGLVIRTKS